LHHDRKNLLPLLAAAGRMRQGLRHSAAERGGMLLTAAVA
jgi:hypothetical protein